MEQLFSSISLYEIFIQVLGIIGIIASILSFQCKDHKRLMILRTVNEMFFAVQYGLLGAFTGMLMNLIGSTRNLVFAKMVEEKKDTASLHLCERVLFHESIAITTSAHIRSHQTPNRLSVFCCASCRSASV